MKKIILIKNKDMPQEDKQLLLQDLGARLTYGVVYHRNDGANIKLNAIDAGRGLLNYTDDIEERDCKPYLRPMSSMTEEERIESLEFAWEDDYGRLASYNENISKYIDWLNKKMFDYRGLIPMGLALEAPKGIYK